MEYRTPEINEYTFADAYDEISKTCGDAYPVLAIAAAIHEFSHMVNKQLTEFNLQNYERR